MTTKTMATSQTTSSVPLCSHPKLFSHATLMAVASFSDFVGKWTLPTTANAVWHAAADAIFENFDWPNREFRPMIPLSARVTNLQAFRNKPASVRADAGFPREFEVKVTHPAVFAVLDETTHPLATLLTDEYLHLYKENAGGLANEVSYRNADAIMFRDA
jgi:hypothetical protein